MTKPCPHHDGCGAWTGEERRDHDGYQWECARGLTWWEDAVQAGQVYESCDPRGGSSIRVVAYTPGAGRADVVDAVTGKRPRSIVTEALHGTGTTLTGRPRRSGYHLTDGGGRG